MSSDGEILEKSLEKLKQGEWADALLLAMKVFGKDPYNNNARYLAAIAHGGLGNQGIAKQFFDIAVKRRKGLPFKYLMDDFPAEAQKALRLLGVKPISEMTSKKELNETLSISAYERAFMGVKQAIESGADVDHEDKRERTALLDACDHMGSFEIAKYLIEHGADVNIKRGYHDTPLGYASMYGKLEHVKLLLENGADVNKKGDYGRTPLHYAATGGDWTEHYTEILKILLEHGADPNLYNEGGDTPLLEAIGAEDFTLEMAKLLIDNGADLELKSTSYDYTPLMRASERGNLELVKLFLENTKPSESLEDLGKTIYEAYKNNNKEVMMYLLKEKEAILDPAFYAKNVLSRAADKGYLDILEYIVDKGLDISKYPEKANYALREAAYKGHLDVIKFLVNHGGDINGGDYGAAENPLMKAARHAHMDLAKFLIEKGANIEAPDYRGNTPLFFATWEGKLGMVKLLLQKGANIDTRNELNWNPLMQACLEGHFKVAKLLIEKGSEVNLVEKEKGATPLILAAHSGASDIITLLLNAGADKLVKDKEGKTAYDHAVEKYNKAAAELLK